jgi:hypothetical protein
MATFDAIPTVVIGLVPAFAGGAAACPGANIA